MKNMAHVFYRVFFSVKKKRKKPRLEQPVDKSKSEFRGGGEKAASALLPHTYCYRGAKRERNVGMRVGGGEEKCGDPFYVAARIFKHIALTFLLLELPSDSPHRRGISRNERINDPLTLLSRLKATGGCLRISA